MDSQISLKPFQYFYRIANSYFAFLQYFFFEIQNHMQQSKIIGYIHLLIQTISLKDSEKQVSVNLSLGQTAKVDTSIKKSGQTWNEVYLIQVPQDPPRLTVVCKSGQQVVGQCRYDVNPFIQHAGLAHSIDSDLYNNENQSQGNIKLKLTYYSAEHGKLKIRIFHMSLVPPFVQKFKTARIKVKLGIHMQSTPQQSLQKDVDQTIQLVVLLPSMNLTFDVVNAQGILATYTINNIQKSNILQDKSKAYQVSLFNNDKAVGLIKYQIDWIKKE